MTDQKLIEQELPLAEVNTASATEKSVRHGHISTMHLWWARRPLAMSRAVVFGSLHPAVADEEERDQVLADIAVASPFDSLARYPTAIERLQERLAAAFPHGRPKVLDCFAGGGAIPLEALRLGCDVTAVDINPVAHLVQRAALEFPQTYRARSLEEPSLVDDFLQWAGWVRDWARPRLAEAFPTGHENGPAVFFWCRTMVCGNPACRAEVPLVTSRWLADSARRKAWISFECDRVSNPSVIEISVHSGAPPRGEDPKKGTIKASSATCPACGTTRSSQDMREYAKNTGLGRRLYACLEIANGVRQYRAPMEDERRAAEVTAPSLLDKLEELPDGTSAVPDEPMVTSQYRRYGNLVYGIDTFRGLFIERQLLVLGTLAAGVRAAHAAMLDGGMDPARAKAVATYLGFMVDKIADYDSSFTSWAASGEFQRSTFPRQAIAMVWDFVETDPFWSDDAIWASHTRWIELALRHCENLGAGPATVRRGNAQDLPFPDGSFDSVVVDPPYYDAIQYGDLSDFFYVWLKRSIGPLYPELFATPLTPKKQEVIETRADKKSAEYVSHDEFEQRLQRALAEMARVVTPDGVVSIVFAHTDVAAWERLLRALRSAGLIVTTSWPMRSEREARSTAQISAVLGSSVVLVCRRAAATEEGFYDEVVRELHARIAERLEDFDQMSLAGADYFVSAIGPAFDVFARYARISRLSGEEVNVGELMVLARQAVAHHAMRRLLGEDTTALDNPSLFYLTWRWAYDGAAVPADEAYKLERAFEVDLSLLARGGLVVQDGQSFTVVGPEDRDQVTVTGGSSTIDILHAACQLWDSGRRKELEQLLAETSAASDPAFWALAKALAQTLPEGDRERTILLGLTGSGDSLTAAASRIIVTTDTPRLFDPGTPQQKDER